MAEKIIDPDASAYILKGFDQLDEERQRLVQDILQSQGVRVEHDVVYDVGLTRQDFVSIANENNAQATIVRDTWNVITAKERLLDLVPKGRLGQFDSQQDKALYETIPRWQQAIILDEQSLSRSGLEAAYQQRRLDKLHGFGKLALLLVEFVLDSTDPNEFLG